MIALNTKIEEQARQEEELAGLDDTEKVYRGYTQKELQEAFNLVVNKSNWKDPTCTKISKIVKFNNSFYICIFNDIKYP